MEVDGRISIVSLYTLIGANLDCIQLTHQVWSAVGYWDTRRGTRASTGRTLQAQCSSVLTKMWTPVLQAKSV